MVGRPRSPSGPPRQNRNTCLGDRGDARTRVRTRRRDRLRAAATRGRCRTPPWTERDPHDHGRKSETAGRPGWTLDLRRHDGPRPGVALSAEPGLPPSGRPERGQTGTDGGWGEKMKALPCVPRRPGPRPAPPRSVAEFRDGDGHSALGPVESATTVGSASPPTDSDPGAAQTASSGPTAQNTCGRRRTPVATGQARRDPGNP